MNTGFWPGYSTIGDYRRVLAGGIVLASLVIAPIAGFAAYLTPTYTATIVPLALAALLVAAIVANTKAQAAARRAEVSRSFAHLAVIRAGQAVKIPKDPIRGEFSTHRDAFREAVRLGSWAVIVKAYGRYYVLRARKVTSDVDRPLAFRTRAVRDLVPAITADDSMSA